MKADGTGLGGRKLLIISIAFILLVGGIFFAISNSLRGSRDDTQKIEVVDVLANRSVRMTVEGPVVANEQRESYRIEVGLDKRLIEAIKGYDTAIVGSSTLGNNRQAYVDFVHALSRAGFDKERRISEAASDIRGACATGERYIFEVLDNGRSVRRLWTTTCSNARGTLDAKPAPIKRLFDVQIPDRKTVLEPIKID